MTASPIASLWMTCRRGGLAVLLALAGAGCGEPSEAVEPAATPTAPPAVETAEVRLEAAPPALRTTGRLVPRSETDLAFPVAGQVTAVLVEEGAQVQAGDPLARLDGRPITARLAEAEAAHAQAARDAERLQALLPDSIVSPERAERAQTLLEQAAARLELARFEDEHAVLRAPAAGRIVRRTAEAGEVVAPGQPIVTLAPAGRGWVLRAGLADRDVVRLAVGDAATVTFDAFPGRRFAARVAEIGHLADPTTGAFDVELLVDAPPADAERLRSGFLGRAAIVPSAWTPRPVLPVEALVEADGATGVVLALDADAEPCCTVRRRAVRLAGFAGDSLRVADGLAPGERVIVAGGRRLTDGDRVTPTDLP